MSNGSSIKCLKAYLVVVVAVVVVVVVVLIVIVIVNKLSFRSTNVSGSILTNE